MSKVFKANLFNDSTKKFHFLSKLPGNLGDLIMNDLDVQNKNINFLFANMKDILPKSVPTVLQTN